MINQKQAKINKSLQQIDQILTVNNIHPQRTTQFSKTKNMLNTSKTPTKKNNKRVPYSIKNNKSTLIRTTNLQSSFEQKKLTISQLLNESSIAQLDKSAIMFTPRIESKSAKRNISSEITKKKRSSLSKSKQPLAINNIYPLNSHKAKQKQINYLNTTDRKPLIQLNKGRITFLIKSNWGNIKEVGLKRVKLIDHASKEIDIHQCFVNEIIQTPINVSNMLSMIKKENNSIVNLPEQCWTYPFENTQPLELKLKYNINRCISSIEIVNYSGQDGSIGVKDLEVRYDTEVIWKGVMPNSPSIDTDPSHSFIDSCLTIKVNSSPRRNIFNKAKDITLLKPIKPKDRTASLTRNHFTHHEQRAKANLSMGRSLDQYRSLNKSTTIIKGKYQHNIKEEDNEEESEYITCDSLRLSLISNYGNLKQIGLTGIKLSDNQDRIVSSQIIKEIKSFPSFSSSETSDNHIINIINTKNETTKKKNMFITGASNELKHKRTFIDISLIFPINLRRITIWNYNSPNHLDKGTKQIHISLYLKSKLVHTAHCLLFKAPGIEGINYSQTFLFPFEGRKAFNDAMLYRQLNSFLFNNNLLEYETPYLPCGFIFKLVLISTWGDENYIGLNAVEVYDYYETKVVMSAIYSYPEKSQIQSNTQEPLLFYMVKGSLKRNCIVFISYSPVCLSCVRIFNYSKHKEIGVKSFQVLCDERIIYEGVCSISQEKGSQIRNAKNETLVLFKPKEAFNRIFAKDQLSSGKTANCYKFIEKDNAKILTLDE